MSNEHASRNFLKTSAIAGTAFAADLSLLSNVHASKATTSSASA